MYLANLRGENNSLKGTVEDLQRTLLEIHGSVFNASGQHRISAIEKFCYDLFKAVVQTAEFKLSEKKEGVSFTIYDETNSTKRSSGVWFDSPNHTHRYKPFVTLIFKGEVIQMVGGYELVEPEGANKDMPFKLDFFNVFIRKDPVLAGEDGALLPYMEVRSFCFPGRNFKLHRVGISYFTRDTEVIPETLVSYLKSMEKTLGSEIQFYPYTFQKEVHKK